MIRFMSTEIHALGIHYGNIDRQNHKCKSRAVPPTGGQLKRCQISSVTLYVGLTDV